MLSLHSRSPSSNTSTATRRELLRVGGLSMLGLCDMDLRRLRAHPPGDATSERRRHNACVFIFLFGGPSHIDLWDMKPDAPAEIRGEFRPIATNVPGIHLCEQLPLLAQSVDRLCLLRSMTHAMPVHGPACSELLTGRPYFGAPITDQATTEDWPSLAALATRFGIPRRGMPTAVVLPWYLQFAGQAKRIAGQTGGRMGERYNPFLITGDPSRVDFRMPSIELPIDLPTDRVASRAGMLRRLDVSALSPAALRSAGAQFDENYQAAIEMLSRPQTARAFDLRQESHAIRERYGLTKFGQSLLLARRLIEAGVSLVTVNWDDPTRSDKVSPHWDTHNKNFSKLKSDLCPVFDRAMAAFLDDFAQRGLLDTTLVVATGEFGRTPKIGEFTQNAMTEKTGRDHWPHAFTTLLAGGGIRGGQVYGATNSTGGYVLDRPVAPADLAATMLLHLGVDLSAGYEHVLAGTRHRIVTGSPVRDLG